MSPTGGPDGAGGDGPGPTGGPDRGRTGRIHLYPATMAGYAGRALAQRLPDVELVTLDDEAALARHIAEVEVLLAWTMPPGHLERAERLRLLHTPGAGVDRVIADPGLADDVVLCNAVGAHEPHMAEFVLATLLAIVKRIPRLVDQQRDHVWRVVSPPTLAGKRACLVGLGAIGRSIATRLRALDVEVVGIRRSGEPVEGLDEVFTPDRRLAALRGADIVVVVTPRTAETVGLIGGAELSMLNPHGYLVDVSRGGVTDAQAVVDALAAGRLEAAALDVFEQEPLPAASPLWDVPGLLVTPHTAGYSPDYAVNLADIVADNVAALDGHGPYRTRVDRDRGY